MIREYTSGDARATLDVFERAVMVMGRPFYTPRQLRAWVGTRGPDRWNAQRLAQHTLVADEGGRVVMSAVLESPTVSRGRRQQRPAAFFR